MVDRSQTRPYIWIFPLICRERIKRNGYHLWTAVKCVIILAMNLTSPAGLSKYVLHSFTDKSPPFDPTTEDVVKSCIPVDTEKITGCQLVRGRGGKLAVMYETHWEGLSSITWEREIDLKNFSRHILEYWMSTPRQMKGVNSKYRAMRRAQSHRAYWRHQNKYYLEQGYHLVSYSTWERKFRGRRVPL